MILSKILYIVNSQRPPLDQRTFTSPRIDKLIEDLKPLLKDQNIAGIFESCLPNTLDTTVKYYDSVKEDSFVITGDIDALWLRDSSNQLMPYLPYISEDKDLKTLAKGLVRRHSNSILIDSFANSFNFDSSGKSGNDHQDDIRIPEMQPAVFEGKYEIDSLNSFLKLSYWYWKNDSNDTSVFDSYWISAVNKTIHTIKIMQIEEISSDPASYLFQRLTTVATDTLMLNGRGPPGNPMGLSRSLFRPSDDAVTLPYNIPGNAMACVELQHLLEMIGDLALKARTHFSTLSSADLTNLLNDTRSLLSSICEALYEMVKERNETSQASPLPYEIDGYGNEYYIDDANLPSLLSLPLLGFISNQNEVYQSTRRFVLSSRNPYWFKGKEAEGIGGPHIGYNYIWPMSIVVQAMTSSNETEVLFLIIALYIYIYIYI